MPNTHPLLHSSAEFDWLRRSHVLNICLLTIGLTMGLIGFAGASLRLGEGRLEQLPLTLVLALLLGAGWLLAAFLFSRVRRYGVAGGLVIVFVLVVLALATYALPGYFTALLPFACLPTALAALLLGRRSVYVTAISTLLSLLAASLAAQQIAPPPLTFALPPSGPALSAAMAATALCFLALTLAPLRGDFERMAGRLRRADIARHAAEAGQQADAQATTAALEGLAARAHNLEAVLQQVGDGVIAIGPDGTIVRANAAARRLWAELATGDLLGQRFEQLRALLAGAAQAVEIAALPAGLAHGEGYTHVLLDRREQARLLRLRTELLGLLADEMRNPLTSMVTALEMTLGQNLPEGADRVLVGARRSGQRLLDLVTTMLEIHQLEHNPGALRRAHVPLRPILDAGIAYTTPLQHQGAVQVVVEYSGDSVVLADGERVRRAFVHLLEHALRQSPPYSTVQVRTECQHEAVIVRISDQGPGLTPQQRDLLFDQRVAPGERKAPALGLAFSKLVIEAHGGQVIVESSGGQGSTYGFSLPIERRAEA